MFEESAVYSHLWHAHKFNVITTDIRIVKEDDQVKCIKILDNKRKAVQLLSEVWYSNLKDVM